MPSILKGVIPVIALLLTLAGYGYGTYKWGFNAARLEQEKDNNKALRESSEAIAATFKEYEQLLSDIEVSKSGAPVPALISYTIKRLPDPSGKK